MWNSGLFSSRQALYGVPARHCQAAKCMHHVLCVATCPPLPEMLACELRGIRGDGRRVESEDTSEAVEDLPIWPGADIPGTQIED